MKLLYFVIDIAWGLQKVGLILENKMSENWRQKKSFFLQKMVS